MTLKTKIERIKLIEKLAEEEIEQIKKEYDIDAISARIKAKIETYEKVNCFRGDGLRNSA